MAEVTVGDVHLQQPGGISTLRLRGLDLSGFRQGGKSSAKGLSDLLSRVPLLLIDLKNCHLTDEAVAALAPGLASCSELAALALSRTDDACSINSCGCGLTQKGAHTLCAALESSTSLQELDLSRHTMGDEGAVAVSALLSRSFSLSTLLLADNGIGEEGCLAISSAAASTVAPLAVLSLADNGIGSRGLAALCAALAGRRGATLRSLELAMDRGTAISANCSSGYAAASHPHTSTLTFTLHIHILTSTCSALIQSALSFLSLGAVGRSAAREVSVSLCLTRQQPTSPRCCAQPRALA